MNEAENLERELNEAPEWSEFGTILAQAHEKVYHVPETAFRTSLETERKSTSGNFSGNWCTIRRVLGLSLGLVLFICVTVGLGRLYWSASNENVSSTEFVDSSADDWVKNTDSDDENDSWEEGEEDLKQIKDQLECMEEDSSLELEYAILEDSFLEWDSEMELEEDIF